MRTILEATRWRLRLVVGLAQWLRVTVKDCQILRPGRTVAATGKDSHDFGGHTMATALFGWARSVASFNRQRLPNTQALPDSRRYLEKIRTILGDTSSALPVLFGLLSGHYSTSPTVEISSPD